MDEMPSKEAAMEYCSDIQETILDIRKLDFGKSEMVNNVIGWRKLLLPFDSAYQAKATMLAIGMKQIVGRVESIGVLAKCEINDSSVAGTEKIWEEIHRLAQIMKTPRFFAGPSLLAIEEGIDQIMRQLSLIPD